MNVENKGLEQLLAEHVSARDCVFGDTSLTASQCAKLFGDDVQGGNTPKRTHINWSGLRWGWVAGAAAAAALVLVASIWAWLGRSGEQPVTAGARTPFSTPSTLEVVGRFL